MSKHSDIFLVRHIIDAIDKIDQLQNRGGKQLFVNDFAIADSFVRELMVIGEASRSLTDEFRRIHPEVPWKEIIGMRDWLVHGYAEIDWERVWDTAIIDIPKLKLQIQGIKG